MHKIFGDSETGCGLWASVISVEGDRMRRVLSQEEIDALFGTAQSSQKDESTAPKKRLEKCELGISKALSADQIRSVTALHESFARRIGDTLETYLRKTCDVRLVAAEQLRYRELLSETPEVSYLASLRMMPIDASALLSLDLSLVFPIVDLTLGGSGDGVTETRRTTEIEDQIIETAIALIARELQIAWSPVIAFDIRFDQRQPLSQAQALMPPNEKILALSFELHLMDLHGALNIALPAVVANALLRRLAAQGTLGDRIPSRNTRRRIRESLLDGYFLVDLSLPPSPLSVRELLNIEPHYVLVLSDQVDKPIHLNVAGIPMFDAHPVRTGTQKGARVVRRRPLGQQASEQAP